MMSTLYIPSLYFKRVSNLSIFHLLNTSCTLRRVRSIVVDIYLNVNWTDDYDHDDNDDDALDKNSCLENEKSTKFFARALCTRRRIDFISIIGRSEYSRL